MVKLPLPSSLNEASPPSFQWVKNTSSTCPVAWLWVKKVSSAKRCVYALNLVIAGFVVSASTEEEDVAGASLLPQATNAKAAVVRAIVFRKEVIISNFLH